MGRIVADTACPQCVKSGRDSTGNHLMLFEDGGGFCNRCGYAIPSGTKIAEPAKKRKLDTMADFNEAKEYPVDSLEARGIDKDVCEHFGVRVSYDENKGVVDSYYYPVTVQNKLVAFNKRVLPKRFYNIGKPLKGQPLNFFGQAACTGSGKKLLICEGKDDAMAAFQILWRKYPKFKPAVVGLPSGDNLHAFKDNEEFLNSFEEIIFCPDQDEAGIALAEKVSSLLESVTIMKISEKDPNDMLKAGKSAEFINSFFRAAPMTPEGFVSVDDVFDEATRMPEAGRPWPWPSLTELTYGRRDGEGMYIGAGAKVGKSEFVNQLAQHIVVAEGLPVALFKLEEKPAMTVRRIAGKVKHKQFHKPDGNFEQSELIEGVTELKDKLYMYDSYRATSWDNVKQAIRHAVIVGGCKDVIIDPITRLTAGMDASQTNTELERFADELSSMAKDLGFFYYCLAHLKAPQTGKPHEEGGKVHSNQFTGSRAMMRACYYMIGIERDKMADDPIAKDTSTFVLLDDRAFGLSGRFSVFYNATTGDYLEPSREFM